MLARHFMYWRVYLHKTIRGAELLLRAAVLRARRLGAFLAGAKPLTWRSIWLSTTRTCCVALKTWAHHADPTLSDLSRRFLSRDFLKPVFVVPPSRRCRRAVKRRLGRWWRQAGYDPDSYCLMDTHGQRAVRSVHAAGRRRRCAGCRGTGPPADSRHQRRWRGARRFPACRRSFSPWPAARCERSTCTFRPNAGNDVRGRHFFPSPRENSVSRQYYGRNSRRGRGKMALSTQVAETSFIPVATLCLPSM